MTRAARSYVILAGAVPVCIAGLMALGLGKRSRWREFEPAGRQGIVIRNASRAAAPGTRRIASGSTLPNIAPYAKVTVSSVDAANRDLASGVADGVADTREWLSYGQTAGAWILLEWDNPAMVEEIDLYDRPSPAENVLSGLLIFDDGSSMPVAALPPDGTPARIAFPPKAVKSVLFRIDSIEGSNAGLEEIMVRGVLNP
jgi:hypothetical protein